MRSAMFGALIRVGWLVFLSRCLLTVCATTSLSWVESDNENSRHCLSDGHQKGPERLKATGHGWFLGAASLSLCVDLWLLSINCSGGTDVSSQRLTAFLVFSIRQHNPRWGATQVIGRLCKNTDRCGSSYDIPQQMLSHVQPPLSHQEEQIDQNI